MHCLTSRKGFTLIELLIVVAIIAILAAIAVPNFLEAQIRAKVASVKSDMRSLTTALESYYVDHNNYVPGSVLKSETYNYIGSNNTMHIGDGSTAQGGFFYMLSTPVAYVSNSFIFDPFTKEYRSSASYSKDFEPNAYVKYVTFNKDRPCAWRGANIYDKSGNLTAYRGQPASASDDGDYNAAGNPQIVWWALYSWGPDEDEGTFSDDKGKLGYWSMERFLQGFKDNSGFSTEECEDMVRNAMVNNSYDPTNGSKSIGNIWRLGGGQPSGTQLRKKYSNAAFHEDIYKGLALTSD